MRTILALTDRADLVRAWSIELASAGFRITGAPDLPAALEMLSRDQPDLILIDLTLPGRAGLELGRQLRLRTTASILVLAGRIEDAERAVTGERIAADFVLDPHEPRELATRVRAVLQRCGVASRPGAIHLGDLVLNPSDRWVAVAGETTYLTATELELLAALAADPGRVYTRAELVRALAGEHAMAERTVDSHVKNLRAKIEPDPRHPRHIVTVHGLGYRLDP